MAVGLRRIIPAALSLGLLVIPPLARSQSQSTVIQLLLTAHDARTRTQAALTLGRLRPAGTREALEAALDDRVASVRAAAVESLTLLGDIQSLGALQAHANDRDPGVRSGIARLVSVMNGPTGSDSAPSNAGSSDWGSARYVVRVGTISNNTDGRAALITVMRDAIAHEMGRTTGIAYAMGSAFPPEAERRVRTGHARAYAIEGSVNTLRRWTVASTVSVRAEVSLVLTSHPSREIVGSLSGAATAQDHTPYFDQDGFEHRLEERALVAAVHGALGNLQQSLAAR